MNDKENYPPRRTWPFDVLPAKKQTEQHKQEISFLENAHREGYQATTCGAGDFGATANERGGLIVVHGRRRWEVVLGVLDMKVASAATKNPNRRPLYLSGKENGLFVGQAVSE